MNIFFPEYCDLVRLHRREFAVGLRAISQVNTGFLTFEEILRTLIRYRSSVVKCNLGFVLEIGELYERLKDKNSYDLVDLEITLIGIAICHVRTFDL